MAMSDCDKCWETPCVCGHEYANEKWWPLERLKELRNVLDKEIQKREHPTRESGVKNHE